MKNMTSVLVIDDSDEFRQLMGQQLASLGYNVCEAADGEQGIKAYQAEPASVVLLDMYMPVKDGFEPLSALLEHDPQARVIVMTGGGRYHDNRVVEPAILMGARKMLYKPITSVAMRSAIEETIAMPM